MDIAAAQSKSGSNVQFLPVILLERRRGDVGDGGRRRGWLLCHRKHMLLAFSSSSKATPAPPQHSRQSGTQATGGNLWKDHSLKHGNSICVFIVREGVCVRGNVHAHM